jgi:purine-binding chemotaxis protein CheW
MNHNDAEKYFVFAHGGLQYALPVMQVLEIVEMPALLPFHGTLPGCLGNVSHREYLLPVLDPTALGSGRPAAAPSKTFVVVREDNAVFGLAMDRFVAVVPLDALESHPEEISAHHLPGSAPTADGRVGGAGDNPFVQTVRAYRGNALISLSAAAVAVLVKRSFGSQRLMTDGEEARLTRRQAVTESERRIFLCARVERVLFGIPVEHVIEVIEGYDVTPLFNMPPIVRGLINLRGQVLACVDISDDLGFPPRPLEERNQFVVLKDNGAELVLCVDRVTGIRRLPPEQIQKADMVLSGEMTRYAAGVLEGEDGALFVLSVAAVFEAPQLQPYRRSEG